ncbi:serine O-acetyltransferase EpsC [Thalassotalea crassostreae]|uniref:serine O-acetyltransferase EpsC n=1 Tax=Thalassotalea crassostreae TaxID=1763536 RepID=UPI000839ACCE|nr:serine O-acetyltransferase EpsC [Thalassotalea crassostreae]
MTGLLKGESNFSSHLFDQQQRFNRKVPSMIKAQKFTEDLLNFFFPFKTDSSYTQAQIELNLAQLQLNFKDLVAPLKEDLPDSEHNICEAFFDKLPYIYTALIKEAENFISFDPAADSVESVILYYPGFQAIAVFRLAHELFKLNVPFLPRMMSEYAHSTTGVDIHPGATIGKNFFIDHATGIVIGETTNIGNNVKLYQGVTLGALYVEKGMEGKKRHPTLEDNVIVYSGTTILGGETIVGKNTIVGGNVWLTKSVPANSVVYHESKTVVRDNKPKNDPIDFVI